MAIIDERPEKYKGWWRDPGFWIDWSVYHFANRYALILAVGTMVFMNYRVVSALESGLSHLKIPVGARAAAMGSAYTAIANDVTSLYWNPAGLGSLRQREISAMHSRWLMGSSYDFLGYAHPTRLGTLGFGLSRLSQPEQEGRGENRDKTSYFGASDSVFTIGYGRRVSDRLHLGLGLKALQSRIGSYKGQGLAMDLGATYRPQGLPVSFGLAARNLGPGVRFIGERTRLPLTLSFGAASSFISGMTLSADVGYRPYDKEINFSLGTEYAFLGALALRAGYQSSRNEGLAAKSPVLSGFAGGLGFRLSRYRIDYTLTPFGQLGNTQRLSLSARF